MASTRAKAWFQATLLIAPLAVFIAWVVVGGVHGTHAPVVPPPPPQPATARVADAAVPLTEPPAPIAASARPASPRPSGGDLRDALAAFHPPDEDYPASKLEDRVDGAADYLRENGCRRILAWKLAEPPADLELLVFAADEGAKAVLARDAGPGRQPGPGDEASVADQSILFRRGPFYARLLADPSAAGGEPAALSAVAVRLDEVLTRTAREGAVETRSPR